MLKKKTFIMILLTKQLMMTIAVWLTKCGCLVFNKEAHIGLEHLEVDYNKKSFWGELTL